MALTVQPDLLGRLALGRHVAAVSGTNGKTTTTALLARALSLGGPVTTNGTGSNLPAGMVGAMLAQGAATTVLEVDEAFLPQVLEHTMPRAVALLNLTRDQLDRTAEVHRLVQRWRDALLESAPHTVVANCDDPLVVWAATGHPRAVWVEAGQSWAGDSALCPRCARVLRREGQLWSCRCGLHRPDPDWRQDGTTLHGPDDLAVPLRLALPGRFNRGNAAVAVATAAAMGIAPAPAAAALCAVDTVQGRYAERRLGSRRVRLLLAKNPAGWSEILAVLRDGPVVVVVNARAADGRDTSWLWDVPFERLRAHEVVAAGERRFDLAVRLSHAGVPHVVASDLVAALEHLPDGVDVVATYSAFEDLRRRSCPTAS